MPGPTPHRALPVPLSTDIPDVPADLGELAIALDFDLFVITGTRPAAGVLGRVHYAAGVWSFDTGLAWTTHLTSVPAGVYLQLAGGTMAGALDHGGQEIRNGVAVNIRDKRYNASVTGGLTINAENGPRQRLTLTGNITSTAVSNLADGESLRVTLVQDATGGRTFAPGGAWVWPGGVASAMAAFKTTPAAVNVLWLDNDNGVLEAFLAGDLKA